MKNTHYPFIPVTGFYSFGIFLNCFLQTDKIQTFAIMSFFLLTSIFLIMSIRLFNKSFVSTIFLLFALTSLGAVYTQSRQYVEKNHISHIAKYFRKKPISVRGVIVSAVTKRRPIHGVKTTFTLDVNAAQTRWGWKKRTGRILVNVFRGLDVDYGDDLQLEGKLHRPYNFSPEKNFSYRDYLNHRGIYYLLSVKKDADIHVIAKNKGNYLKSLSLKTREHLISILTRHLSRNESGIMRAILLGDRSRIVKPVRTLFVRTGTAHVLAISGLHIGVVAALFLMFAKFIPIGRRAQLGGVIILLISYAFLTGGRPSIVRATIMIVVFLAGFILEKDPDALNSLFLAAMSILLFNPLNLFDVGFQLSFVCVFSILYLNVRLKWNMVPQDTGKIKQWSSRVYNRWSQFLSRSLVLSLMIWIGAAGLIAFYFGLMTPVTIFANLLIVPLISIVITLGFSLLVSGIVLPSCAFIFAACLKVALNAMVGIIFLCAKIPFAYIYLRDVKMGHIMAYYIILSLAVFIPWGKLWGPFKEIFMKIFNLGRMVQQVHHITKS